MKVLFLDIDGVFNGARWFALRGDHRVEHGEVGSDLYLARRQLDPATVLLMNDVVRRTGCAVVLSSSCRIAPGMERMANVLRLGGATFELLDRTPSCAQKVGSLYIGSERGAEIREWLDGHPEVTKFAIVDDADDMGPLADRLVQTKWATGLTRADAMALIGMLGEEVTHGV